MSNAFEFNPLAKAETIEKREEEETLPENLFGVKLREARKASGVGLKTLARKMGLNQTSVSNWEDGTTLPSEDKLELISQYYGINLASLQVWYKISKDAREKYVEARKKEKPIHRPFDPHVDVYGEGGSVGGRAGFRRNL